MSNAAGELRVSGEARWIRPENIHLTLKFLGEVSEHEVEKVVGVLEKVAERHASFGLTPSGFGGFPRMEKAKVVWVGMKGGTTTLRALAEDIEGELGGIGFERESRPFSPHFTVGRAKKRPVGIEARNEAKFPAFEAKDIHLIKSETKKEGARYEPLKTFRLSR